MVAGGQKVEEGMAAGDYDGWESGWQHIGMAAGGEKDEEGKAAGKSKVSGKTTDLSQRWQKVRNEEAIFGNVTIPPYKADKVERHLRWCAEAGKEQF